MRLKNMLRSRMAWASPGGALSDVVLSSRVRLARNLADAPFPSRAGRQDLERVLKRVLEAAARGELAQAARIRLDEVDATDRVFLIERHLVSSLLAAHPESRAVLVGEGEALSVMVNEEDHLRLQGIGPGLDLERLLGRVNRLDDQLSARLPVAFDRTWGYLTSCPTNAGTGLRASCLVHLPALALAGALEPVLAALSRRGITARGLYGEGTKAMGSLFQVSNATALGPSEARVVEKIQSAVEALARQEARARQALAAGHERPRAEDLVYRSLGVLTHARVVSFEEALGHLSLLRMGLSLGWKLPADPAAVVELMVLVRPAHIQMLAGRELDAEDRDYLRATLLRRRLGAAAG